MHFSVLWLLFGLGTLAFSSWRLLHSRRKRRELLASREAAMAIALAEAQKAASAARARRDPPAAGVDAVDSLPLITRTITRPNVPAAPRSATARVEAERIAYEAARRAKAQRQAQVDSERAASEPALPEPVRPAAARVTHLARRPEAPPAKTADAPRVAVAAKPPAAPRIAKTPAQTLIMVVDDSKMVRIKTSRLLEAQAYQVVTAIDGLDAIRQLENCRPDLLITDVDMPGLDGFGLTRHLRGDARTAGLPIVMITSSEERHREDAKRVGVGLVLGKPYPEDALIEHIRSFQFEAVPTH